MPQLHPHPMFREHVPWRDQPIEVLEYWLVEYTALRMMETDPGSLAHYIRILVMVTKRLDERRSGRED